MKTCKTALVFLFVALFVAPLVSVNSSLFYSGKQKFNRGFNLQMLAKCVDRPLEIDFAKLIYYPDEWVDWYWLSGIGCTSITEEDMEGSEWIMTCNTDVVRTNGKLVMVTSTDLTDTPTQMGRYEYTYTANSQNLPATITSSYYSNNQWNFDKRQTYTYNIYGGLTQLSIDEYYNGGGWVPIEQATCVSNMDRLTEVTDQEYNFDLMVWENSMHMVLSWTGNHANEAVKQDWNGSAWQNSDRTVFTYWGSGELHQATMTEWVSSQNLWMGCERFTFTFEDNLWLEELIEDYSETLGWIPRGKGIISNNNEGYPTTQMRYSWENENWEEFERLSFYYEGSDVQDDSSPGVPLVISHYPNPFVGTTTVSYKLPQSAQTELGIYNIRGQLVRKLVNEPVQNGQHTVTWDGKDDNGKALASGMYLYQISSAGKQETHKMLLLK